LDDYNHTMARLFILEDCAQDARVAEAVARSVGFDEVLGHLSVNAAVTRLLASLSGASALPDAFLIDLDLGAESGYEVLRLRHGNPKLARIPAIVWSRLDHHHQELCEVFNIRQFVDKGRGTEALKSLSKLLPNP